jgi:hypothetical protein
MRYFKYTLISLLFLLGAVACNENRQFEEELYKKVFAIVSSGGYNMFEVEHSLDAIESTGYVSISMGGTNPTETDTRITLFEDANLFNRYNRGNYDVETEEYARLLPAGHYTIDSYDITIPAGQREARLPIKIRPEGLSPDSTYFVSLKVKDYSHYEVNPEKADVLYRVLLKNFYAVQKSPGTTYDLRGKIDEGNELGSKRMFPLTGNSVRIMAGNPTGASAIPEDTAVINRLSIRLEIADNGHVTISSFKPGRVQIEQLDDDPDYPNIFFIDDDGFFTYKSFLLHYRYKVEGESVREVREELRLEFKDYSK